MSTQLPERSQCTPCRGSGRVLSNLGGERHEVICPWCGGSGRFVPGRDAQQHAPAARAPVSRAPSSAAATARLGR